MLYMKALLEYPKRLTEKMMERKMVNKRVEEFTTNMLKNVEKSHIPNIKETLTFF